MMTNAILPDLDAPLTAPFWAAAREERLVAQRCARCSYLRWPPAPICPECLSADATWEQLSGVGTVWSYTVYRRAMHPAFADAVPYTVAVVQLAEGGSMIGTIVTSTGDADSDGEVRIGDEVHAVFDPVTPEVTVVRWRRPAA